MKRETGFAPLAGAEYHAAISALLAAAFEPVEFILEEQRTELRMAGGDPQVFKLVSVKRVTAGLQRVYNSGRGGTWPFAFERDLRCGSFGKPKKLVIPTSARSSTPFG